jgi:hypothetical protein
MSPFAESSFNVTHMPQLNKDDMRVNLLASIAFSHGVSMVTFKPAFGRDGIDYRSLTNRFSNGSFTNSWTQNVKFI